MSLSNATVSSTTQSTTTTDERMIIWFDIDNTLYSARTQIAQEMGKRIHEYFLNLGLNSAEEASALHLKYFTTYGLALRGLTKHHDIDPIEFDKKCDGTLPLEDMISCNETLIQLFKDIDRSKARVWALTNAYRPHAQRVLHILGLSDQVEDIVFCDYARTDFPCKPEPQYYHEALEKAGVTDPSKCYFVDDNRKNVDAARKLGWNCIHFCEEGLETMEGGKVKKIANERSPTDTPVDVIKSIKDLEELRKVWPHIFKS